MISEATMASSCSTSNYPKAKIKSDVTCNNGGRPAALSWRGRLPELITLVVMAPSSQVGVQQTANFRLRSATSCHEMMGQPHWLIWSEARWPAMLHRLHWQCFQQGTCIEGFLQTLPFGRDTKLCNLLHTPHQCHPEAVPTQKRSALRSCR